MDGISFAPLLRDPQAAWRNTLLIESLSRDPQQDRNVQAVRTTRYVYAELQSGYAELYDLQNDPKQLTNLVNDPAYTSIVSDMKSRLNGFKFQTNLSLTQQTSATSTTAGSDVTYTVEVRNNGPRAAQSITINNLLPSNMTFVSCTASSGGVCQGHGNQQKVLFLYLAVNETQTATLVARVMPTVSSGTIIHNSANVSAMTSTDPQPSNDSATTSISVVAAAEPEVIFANGFETGI
jgi:uncharacterized repeat protein (TIGR01451 family)